MSNELVPTSKPWGLAMEKFFYFFMGLRKGEIRKQVAMMKALYPEDDAHRMARRFVGSQAPLSLLGGALLQAPKLIPATAPPVLKLLGIATGASVMVRLNMTLLLQIALLFGHDIDDRARLKEMAAIIAATGLAGGASLLPQLAALTPTYKALAGGAAIAAVSQALGEAAIAYYGGAAEDLDSISAQIGIAAA